MPKMSKRKKRLLQHLELANKIKAERRQQREMPENIVSAVKRTDIDAGNQNIRRVLQPLNLNPEVSLQELHLHETETSFAATAKPLNLNAEVSLQELHLHETENSFAATAVKHGNPDVGITLQRDQANQGDDGQENQIAKISQYEDGNEENVELEIAEEEKPASKKDVRGRRIVDINSFVKQLLDIASHGPLGCTSQMLELVGEKQNGLVSTFTFQCKMCNIKFYINSDLCDENYVNVNCCAVAGTVAIGCGQSQLEEFLSCVNLPTVSQHLYDKNHELIHKHWEITANEQMKQAADREKEISIAEGRVTKDGIPIIDVIADGCWSKRSFKKNYSALSGAATIIGKNTGKILYLGVKNKYCQTCTNAESKGRQPNEHLCFKNYTGSSTSMESQILVEGFKSSIEQHGLIYGRLISDGDSSTYSKILETRPYPDVTVEKVECRNHILRNFCNKLNALSTETKYPLKFRKLITRKAILTIRCVIVKSIKKNKIDSDVQCLFEDILTSHLHAFGNHSKCKIYFCNRITNPDGEISVADADDAIPSDFFLSTMWQKICSLVQSVAGHSRSLFYDVDSNAVENFHSIVAKLVGGKRINFSKKSSYKTRCLAAAVGFNTRKTISMLYTSINKGASPQGRVKKLERARIRKALLNKKNKKAKRKLPFSKEKKSVHDSNYGTACHTVDMAVEQFEKLKLKHLEGLKKTDKERQIIQEKTVHQSQCSEWLELRRSLLTASNFGKIIKMRPDTSCASTVKQLLYKADLGHVPSISHGRNKESDAIKLLAKQLHIKIDPCGLFIDEDLPYLGATPDGLCGDDAVVEIKCPMTAYNIGIDAAINTKKVTFWKKNKSGTLEINQTHNWFYQVQGQLHITKRTRCIFAVWANDEEPLKTEIILKDDDFWRDKMENKLTTFYINCILPELVDPRHPRNMPIRDPSPIREAIKKKTEKQIAKNEGFKRL